MARLTSNGILFDLIDTNNKIDSYYWMYPSGTRKLFFQASAPPGWTQDTSMGGNKALRVVSGTGTGSGGVTPFTTVLNSTAGNIGYSINTTMPVQVTSGAGTFIGNHTLSLSELPDHTHPSNVGPTGGSNATPFSNAGVRTINGSNATGTMIPAGGGGSHGHPFSGSSTINQSFTNTVDLAVNYVDVIICSLN